VQERSHGAPRETHTVYGFHGTSIEAASSILEGGFRSSRNEYDWLGDGVYFFQDAPTRAWEWATALFGAEAAVVGARIRCDPNEWMDLLDIRWATTLADVHDAFLAELKRSDLPLPRQTTGAHRLDRAVINYAVGILEQQQVIIRAVRAAFAEGASVFPGSALFDRAHVQIAVRDMTLIEAVWLEQGGDYRGAHP
jgi:hypothetical protein